MIAFFLLATETLHAQGVDSLHQYAQKDLVDILIKTFKLEHQQQKRTDKKVNFSLVPIAVGSSPSGKVAVSSINAAFYLGDPATTNLSNIYLIPYTNLSSQRGVIIRPTLWLNKNEWNFTGEFRGADNSLNTYGLGSQAPNTVESVLEVNQLRLYATAHRLLFRYFYAGMGYNLDYYYNMHETPEVEEESDMSRYGIGINQSATSSGLTFNLLRDSRKNSINPTGGFYTALIYKFNPPALGSTYSWQSFYADARKYLSFRTDRHSILGFWLFYWGTYGEVPYLNLPGTAQDFYGRSGRGYHYGRFRGKQMLYAETEYRFDLSANGFWGGVVFANAQSYTEPGTNNFQNIKPAGGFGLRIKFNKKSDANVTLDVAFGKNSFNWYLNLGEFF